MSMIEINDKLPSVDFQYFKDGEMTVATTEELFAGKTVVLFALPGAFTPTCSNQHLPGFVEHHQAFFDKGVDAIICTSVNDAFVMDAWGKSLNVEPVIMLADGDAEFAKAIGLDKESGRFGGTRSRRYSMLVKDGVMTILNLDEPKQFEVSSAERLLSQL